MAIPSSLSLIFEVKSTGSELAFIRVLRLQTPSDVSGRLRTSSGIFGNDRVVFKNPSTPRIKISRLYLRKSWQVYYPVSLFSCIFKTFIKKVMSALIKIVFILYYFPVIIISSLLMFYA